MRAHLAPLKCANYVLKGNKTTTALAVRVQVAAAKAHERREGDEPLAAIIGNFCALIVRIKRLNDLTHELMRKWILHRQHKQTAQNALRRGLGELKVRPFSVCALFLSLGFAGKLFHFIAAGRFSLAARAR